MRLTIERHRLLIIPDQPDHDDKGWVLDEAFIERVLGLRVNGDEATCRRVNALNLNCIAYLEIVKKESNE